MGKHPFYELFLYPEEERSLLHSGQVHIQQRTQGGCRDRLSGVCRRDHPGGKHQGECGRSIANSGQDSSGQPQVEHPLRSAHFQGRVHPLHGTEAEWRSSRDCAWRDRQHYWCCGSYQGGCRCHRYCHRPRHQGANHLRQGCHGRGQCLHLQQAGHEGVADWRFLRERFIPHRVC